MSAISTYLEYIRSKIYAKDVRTAIVNAISQCYDDVNKPALQTDAMQRAVQAKIDAGEIAALTIGDGSLTGAKLANGTIPTAKIADGAITAEKIASGAVPAVDATLTQTGAAADAKKTGDEISELKADINDALLDGYLDGFVIDHGTLIEGENVKSSTGETQTASEYSRTDYLDVSSYAKVKFSSYSTVINAICFYDEQKTYVSGISGPAAKDAIDVPSLAKYAIYSGYVYDMNRRTLIGTKNTLTYHKADRITFNGVNAVVDTVPLQNVNGVTKFPGNLLNPTECIDNYYANIGNGALVPGSSYFATGYIPVTAGTTYRANHGRNLAWYDSSRAYLSGVSGTAIQTAVTAPENAAYIRFTINKNSDGIMSPIDLYFTDTTQYDDQVQIKNLKIPDDFVVHPWCYGKTINWLGDSIVAGQDFDEVVSSTLGLVETDYGVNGSTIALAEDGTDGRNALCIRYANMSNDADIIAVSAGTNDFEYAWCPIGTIDDPDDGTSNDTFYGALKTLCKGLISKYPHKVIFFTTPIKRMQPFTNGDGGAYTADYVDTTPFSKNKYGKTLGDYADIIKEVCGYYSIPVLDMYHESLLNPHISEQQDCFTKETSSRYETSFYYYTHPNVTGMRIMARRVCGWMTQLGYTIDGLA